MSACRRRNSAVNASGLPAAIAAISVSSLVRSRSSLIGCRVLTPSSSIQLGRRESSKKPQSAVMVLSPLRLPCRSRDAEIVQGPVVVAPVGVHLHTEIQEDAGFERLLEVLARFGAD